MSYIVPRHLPVSSATGVKTIMIPPGAYWFYVEDTDGGTIKMRFETESATRDSATVG